MNRIILTKGLPASGKSTYAKSMVKKTKGATKRVNRDDLREMINSSIWNKENESLIIEIRDWIILESLLSGFDIIVDDTNLNPIAEHQIRKRFGKIAKIVVKDFTNVPLETCIDRNSQRESPVPTDVIIDMYEKYIQPKETHR